MQTHFSLPLQEFNNQFLAFIIKSFDKKAIVDISIRYPESDDEINPRKNWDLTYIEELHNQFDEEWTW